MPPRIITAGIIAFWLAMTGLLIQREVVPLMLADVSPTYQPDLTDEIGSPLIGWNVLKGEDRIGAGTSKVVGKEDGSFEFRSTFHFDKFAIGPAHVRTLENTYRVTEQGKLLAIATTASISMDARRPPLARPDLTITVEGEVVNEFFEPRIRFLGGEHKLDKIHMRQEGSIINPMHLVNRLRGLRPGQTWKVKRLDAFDALANQMAGNFGKTTKVPDLIAEVREDTFEWAGRKVSCLVIDYREPAKEVSARTWVRRRDGLVLKQMATFGFEMNLVRSPN